MTGSKIEAALPSVKVGDIYTLSRYGCGGGLNTYFALDDEKRRVRPDYCDYATYAEPAPAQEPA